MKKLLNHRNNINLYSKLKKRNIYIFHICTFKVYLDNMPDEPYICRGEEQFSYVHCLLFLFDLCLFANDPRFPISRFIVYQLLLLLDYTYIHTGIHGPEIFTNCTVGIVHKDLFH